MRFLLVDRIDALRDDGITGAKLSAQSEDVLEWHFPERPIMPGTVVMESCVQLAGWWHAHRSTWREWLLLTHVESARYETFNTPGDTLILDVNMVDAMQCVDGAEGNEALLRFEATVRCGEDVRASVRFTAKTMPLEEIENPRDIERTFNQMASGVEPEGRSGGDQP